MIPTLAIAALSAAVVMGDHDAGAKLDKPPLEQNLDFLKPGLSQNLKETAHDIKKWDNDMIPEDCKNIAQGKVADSINLNPMDIDVYDVKYEDCGDAWVFCHHKDSTLPIEGVTKLFGQLPIQMREYVKHVFDAPVEGGGWAFEYGGNTAYFNPSDDMITVFAHETGHSLDLNKAYNPDHDLSSSDEWWDAYSADSNVPDPYSGTNSIEDVAQNTVVALFDENVPGKFPGVEPNWGPIHSQYDLILRKARDAGAGNSILLPGANRDCKKRMENGKPVPKGDGAAASMASVPDVSFKSNVEIIKPALDRASNLTACNIKW